MQYLLLDLSEEVVWGNLHDHVDVFLVAGQAVELDDVRVVKERLNLDLLQEATRMLCSWHFFDDLQSDYKVEVADTSQHNIAVDTTSQLSNDLKTAHL